MRFSLSCVTLLFVSIFSICSCKKSDSTKPGVDTTATQKVKLLTSINYTGQNNSVTSTYTYDSKHRLIQNDEGNGALIKFTYDDNDRIIQEDQYVSGVIQISFKFAYKSGGIDETDITYAKGVVLASSPVSITLDNNQHVIIRDLNPQDPGHIYSQYTYDNAGNQLSEGTLTAIQETYTYDKYKSLFINAKGNINLFFEITETHYGYPNNLITTSSSSIIGTGTITTTYSYTYDADGYPKSRTVTSTAALGQPNITETYNYTLL